MAEAVALVPSVVLFLLNLVTGVGFLALPIAVSLDLLIRHRGRQLLDAMTGTVLAALTVITLNATIVHVDSLRQLHFALSVGLPAGSSRPRSASCSRARWRSWWWRGSASVAACSP